MWILFFAFIQHDLLNADDENSSLENEDSSVIFPSDDELLDSLIPSGDLSSPIDECDLDYFNYNTSLIIGSSNISLNGHSNDISCLSSLVDKWSAYSSFIYFDLIFQISDEVLNLNFTNLAVSFSFSIDSDTNFTFSFLPPPAPYHFTFSNANFNSSKLEATRIHVLNNSSFVLISPDSSSSNNRTNLIQYPLLKNDDADAILPFESADVVYFDRSTFNRYYTKLSEKVNHTGFETSLNVSSTIFNDDHILLVYESGESFIVPYDVKTKFRDLNFLLSINQSINICLNTTGNVSNITLTSETNSNFDILFVDFENSTVNITITIETKEGIEANPIDPPPGVTIVPTVLFQPSIPQSDNSPEEESSYVVLIVCLSVGAAIIICVVVIILVRKHLSSHANDEDSSAIFQDGATKSFNADLAGDLDEVDSDDVFV